MSLTDFLKLAQKQSYFFRELRLQVSPESVQAVSMMRIVRLKSIV
jgi:hypothetical protein